MADVTRCPVCGEECYAPGVAQAILDATRTLSAENERLRAVAAQVLTHYSASLDYQPPYVRMAREALEATDEPG